MANYWDLFEIFDAREDNYTNMLYFLYEEDETFRRNLLQLVFGKNIEDVKFMTRTSYRRRENAGKIVPDIILHNTNYFAIIEVKLFSGEGYNQTQRYYKAREDIMHALEVDVNCKQRYIYLTLHGAEAGCKDFDEILWNDVADCMEPANCSNELAKLLMSQFKKRIASMQPAKIDLSKEWEEQVRSHLWSGANQFYAALEHLFNQLNEEESLKPYGIKWRGEKWTGFKPATNSYAHSAMFCPLDKSKKWQGLPLKEAFERNDPSSCYDYHFEFEWNEVDNHLTLRLDYHLNPYMSQKEIAQIPDENLKQFAEACNIERAEKARINKDKWRYNDKIPERYQKGYNGRITSALMTLVTVNYGKEDLKNKNVNEVLALIRPFVVAGTKFITENFLPNGCNI